MRDYQNILAAIDFSDTTHSVIQTALSLAKQYEARVSVLNVVEYTLPMDADYVMPPIDEVEENLVSKAHERLENLLSTLGETSVERFVVAGHPKQEILRFAEQEGADLLVVGAHGHHGIPGLLGSTTDRLVHRADCDVLVVRHKASDT